MTLNPSRRSLIKAAAAATVALSASASATAAAFPERPITLIVPYAAGGGTDAVGRVIANEMEKSLGQPVNVVNRTGGNGVVGLTAMATAAPDGYTIGLMTVEATLLSGLGFLKVKLDDVTPLALVNADPVAVFVSAESKYKSLDDLIQAVKLGNGKIKASGAALGGIYHVGTAGMLKSVGLDPRAISWIPSNGAAPALQDLVAGGIQVAVGTLPEARSLIDAGKVRPLVVMATERSPLFAQVPTLKEAKKSDWLVLNWRGIIGPKGLPKEVHSKLTDAITKAIKSEQYQQFLTQRGFGAASPSLGELGPLMRKSEADLVAVAKESGLTKAQ